MGFFDRVMNGLGKASRFVNTVAAPINAVRQIKHDVKHNIYKPIRNAGRTARNLWNPRGDD
jgi:hypothetical protein